MLRLVGDSGYRRREISAAMETRWGPAEVETELSESQSDKTMTPHTLTVDGSICPFAREKGILGEQILGQKGRNYVDVNLYLDYFVIWTLPGMWVIASVQGVEGPHCPTIMW